MCTPHSELLRKVRPSAVCVCVPSVCTFKFWLLSHIKVGLGKKKFSTGGRRDLSLETALLRWHYCCIERSHNIWMHFAIDNLARTTQAHSMWHLRRKDCRHVILKYSCFSSAWFIFQLPAPFLGKVTSSRASAASAAIERLPKTSHSCNFSRRFFRRCLLYRHDGSLHDRRWRAARGSRGTRRP